MRSGGERTRVRAQRRHQTGPGLRAGRLPQPASPGTAPQESGGGDARA